MVGTQGDVSMAAAIINEIPNFDVQKAYEAIRKNAYESPPPGTNEGRDCLDAYGKYGYVPHGAGCSEVVARSLNYMQSDWAISQAATKLGFNDDAGQLYMRSMNYSRIFDTDTGFFRSRMTESEKYTEPFDEFAWGGDYTEGGPW
jgi:putative alpha-1,2-mannosidase